MPAKKLPSRLCKKIATMIDDEAKAVTEYGQLGDEVQRESLQSATVFERIISDERVHRRLLTELHAEKCRRKR